MQRLIDDRAEGLYDGPSGEFFRSTLATLETRLEALENVGVKRVESGTFGDLLDAAEGEERRDILLRALGRVVVHPAAVVPRIEVEPDDDDADW